jgi:hypothetical protein
MKNGPLTSILLVLLALSALLSLGMCFFYVKASREVRAMQGQVAMATRNRALVNELGNDAMAYSKHNPAIIPIIESIIGPQPKTNQVPAPKNGK